MSFQVQIGTVNKRLNSTYQPTTELVHTIDVVLKESCSDYTPTFVLKNPSNTFPYNYLKWGSWYYYITNVIRDKNQMIIITCTLDELATFKSNIVNSVQFVAYDSTANSEIVDTRLSVNTTPTRSVSYASSSMFETGCVLVGLVGTDNTGVYALTPAQAGSLLNRISTQWLDDADMLPVPDVSDFTNWDDAIGVFVHNVTVGIRQLIATGKAPDCIKSCIYVPAPIEKFSGSSARIWLGEYDTGINGKLLSTAGHADEVTSVSIPWQFTDWRRNQPYTYVYLSLPYVGTIHLPSSEIIGLSSLGIEIHIGQDGCVYYNITGGSGYSRILRFGANCSSNYMIGASNISPLNAVSGAGAVAGAGIGAMLATTPLGLAAAGTGAIAGFLNAVTSLPSSVGGTGGGSFTDSAVISCFTICHNTCVDPSSVSVFMGTPTMAVKSLAGLTGYVECRNASVSIDASNDTINRVNNALNGGIYIE